LTVKDFAEVGFGMAALFVIFKLGCTFLDGYFKGKAAGCDPNIIEVINNNTRVVDKLSDLMNKVLTGQREQAVQMDELLSHARRQQK
jgi:hypothetical protein